MWVIVDNCVYICTRKSDSCRGMSNFIGSMESSLDAKGRVFLPAAFRKTMLASQYSGELNIVICRDFYQPCLTIYPFTAWTDMRNELLGKLNPHNDNDRTLLRSIDSNAEQISVDGMGRILISKRLLNSVGLSGKVRFIGRDTTIEVWSNDAFSTHLLSCEDIATEMNKRFNNVP